MAADPTLVVSPGPWFRAHPRAVLALAAALGAAVFALLIGVGTSNDSLSGLFVLPIALVAIAFGGSAGLSAGAAGVGCVIAWALTRNVSLSPLGWVGRAIPLLLLGWLVGRASDRLRDTASRERRLVAAAVLQREAAEINDTVVQGLTAAKWLFEADDPERGLALLTDTMATAQDLVARQLGARSPLPGDLRRALPATPPRSDTSPRQHPGAVVPWLCDHRPYAARRGPWTLDCMLVDEGLELLTEDEARSLLATGEVGRVGITIGAMPAIFPVNYRVIDGSILFRTSPGSKMAAAVAGAVVAFEVDDYELADRTGWSVLAVGRSQVVHDLDVTFRLLDAHLEPLADGRRANIVRITPEFISGRRIVHEPAA